MAYLLPYFVFPSPHEDGLYDYLFLLAVLLVGEKRLALVLL